MLLKGCMCNQACCLFIGILWQVETGHMLRLFQGHKSLVQCSAFSPCMRMLATGSWDHSVRVWPLKRSSSGKWRRHYLLWWMRLLVVCCKSML